MLRQIYDKNKTVRVYVMGDVNINLLNAGSHTQGGGGGTPPKLGYNAQHKLKIWTLRDLKTSEKGGLKDLKRVFDKF